MSLFSSFHLEHQKSSRSKCTAKKYVVYNVYKKLIPLSLEIQGQQVQLLSVTLIACHRALNPNVEWKHVFIRLVQGHKLLVKSRCGLYYGSLYNCQDSTPEAPWPSSSRYLITAPTIRHQLHLVFQALTGIPSPLGVLILSRSARALGKSQSEVRRTLLSFQVLQQERNYRKIQS